MVEKMKSIVREHDTCVLATATDNNPHCSLMSYVTNPECTAVYMVTRRDTKKYKNLGANPLVSLLIDTREGGGPDRSTIKALTVAGNFRRVSDPAELLLVRGQLLERHPHLRDFLTDAGVEVFAIKIKSFQLLDGITEATFVEIE